MEQEVCLQPHSAADKKGDNMLLRKNFSSGLLASPLTTESTTMIVKAGHTLPAVSGSFVVIVWNATSYSSPAADPGIEIILASYSGTPNLYNITRAQEGTLASTHQSDDKIALTITAGVTTADMLVLGTKDVDEGLIGDGKVPYYDAASGKIKYTALAGGLGLVAIAAGGTGQTTAQAAIDALTDVAGATNEHVLTKDTSTGNAVFKAIPSPSANVYVADTSKVALLGVALTERTTTETSYTKVKEFVSNGSGSIYFSMEIKTGNAPNGAYVKIYKNGSAVGTEKSNLGATYAEVNDTVSGLVSGDLIQVYLHGTNGATAYLRNVKLYATGMTVNTD